MGNFKKGFLLGSLITAGSLIGFAMTKKGKKLSDELRKELKPLTTKLQSQLIELKEINQEKFNELANTLVEELGKKKELADKTKNALIGALQEKWEEMEELYNKDKKDKN